MMSGDGCYWPLTEFLINTSETESSEGMCMRSLIKLRSRSYQMTHTKGGGGEREGTPKPAPDDL